MRAFLFPGQGSQKVGMGRALCEAFPAAQRVFDEADEALGFSLSRLCFEGPEAELTLTAHAQPAILTTSVAALRVLADETGLPPTSWPGTRWVNSRRWWRPGRSGSPTPSGWCTCAASSCRRRCPRAPAAWPRCWGWTRRRSRRPAPRCGPRLGLVVSPANLNGGGQVVIAGAKAGGRSGGRGAEAEGGQAGGPAAGERPLPLRPDAAGGRSPGGRAGQASRWRPRSSRGHQRRGASPTRTPRGCARCWSSR